MYSPRQVLHSQNQIPSDLTLPSTFSPTATKQTQEDPQPRQLQRYEDSEFFPRTYITVVVGKEIVTKATECCPKKTAWHPIDRQTPAAAASATEKTAAIRQTRDSDDTENQDMISAIRCCRFAAQDWQPATVESGRRGEKTAQSQAVSLPSTLGPPRSYLLPCIVLRTVELQA